MDMHLLKSSPCRSPPSEIKMGYLPIFIPSSNTSSIERKKIKVNSDISMLQNSGVFHIFEILNVRQNQTLESQTLAKSLHIKYSSTFSLLSPAACIFSILLQGFGSFWIKVYTPLFGISSEGVCMDIPTGCMLSDKARKLNWSLHSNPCKLQRSKR